MPPAAQVGHRVDGQQNREIQLGLLFRERQAQVELPAALQSCPRAPDRSYIDIRRSRRRLCGAPLCESGLRRWRRSGSRHGPGRRKTGASSPDRKRTGGPSHSVGACARSARAGSSSASESGSISSRVTTLGGTAASPAISPSTYCSFLSTGQPL